MKIEKEGMCCYHSNCSVGTKIDLFKNTLKIYINDDRLDMFFSLVEVVCF